MKAPDQRVSTDDAAAAPAVRVAHELTVALPPTGAGWVGGRLWTVGDLRDILGHAEVVALRPDYGAHIEVLQDGTRRIRFTDPPVTVPPVVPPVHPTVDYSGATLASAAPVQFRADDEVPIDSLGLSTRSYNILRREGVHTVGALTKLSVAELERFRNSTPRDWKAMQEALRTAGRELRVDPESPTGPEAVAS